MLLIAKNIKSPSSVATAFTVAEVELCFARILWGRVSQWQGDSLNMSSCAYDCPFSSSALSYARTKYNSAAKKVYKIYNLTDEEATLVEPAACAIHGLDKLSPPVGIDALIIGAGPTGLILAQLLKLNGAAKVVIAANKGIKTDIAKQLDAGDEYIELDRVNPGPQWEKLKADNPYGFDVVVCPASLQRTFWKLILF